MLKAEGFVSELEGLRLLEQRERIRIEERAAKYRDVTDALIKLGIDPERLRAWLSE